MPTYTLVFIGGEGDPLAAPTFPLVAALIALDVQPNAEAPFVDTIEDTGETEPAEEPGEEPVPILRRAHRWVFPDRSECGAFVTDRLRKQWIDAEWLAANPLHPLARIRAAFHLAGVADLDRPDEEWINRTPASLEAFKASASAFGKLPPQWLDETTRRNFPADPWRRVGDAFAVLPLLAEQLEQSVPLMTVRSGKRHVRIPIDATPAEEALLLSKLDKKTNQ